MTLFLPVYVEELPATEGGEGTTYVARPLQAPLPVRQATKLQRALALLQGDLQRQLLELSRDTRHDGLARWCRLPDFETLMVEPRIELKGGTVQRRFLLAGYTALGRRLFFTPKLPELHFEVSAEQRPAERAAEVLNRHFREMERADEAVDLDDYALPKGVRARVTVVEAVFKPVQNAMKAKKTDLTAIFGDTEPAPNGEDELRKVGRCLNQLPVEELPPAMGRGAEAAELERRLRLKDRRAILLVGPRQAGKTAVVLDVVRRMKEARGAGRRTQVWLVSPMRMISGMSYVGQWQNRVQAICDHLEKTGSVLYLDDLPGMFTAGPSASSDLSVAHLIKPRLENGSLRLLAEITPEAWRVLKERDRTLADFFVVLPVNEPAEADTVRILVNVARDLERAHGCRFDLEVVPAVYELHRRFATDAAFPGKAAAFLQRLAVKAAGMDCTRHMALVEFRERSGLQLAMLDSSREMSRSEILHGLRRDATGQDAVLEAFADVLVKLKARLNDPRRPLAAFLMLGPTGVGKTQCAKALARYLFGSAERLLRFDMNEMVDGTAVPRLTGTPSQPDGLLTGAVRRQPFSVVLFDEIEKAAPEVFDMLLGVLDEGRLSDALGRVADFTSCVILMTSNLGVREAGSRLGFGEAGAAGADMEAAYVKAAEKFFRPEFFNRLDRVLPFRELTREHLMMITQRLITELMGRDGLRQRRCLFDLTEDACARLVELGHHPQLGARALKRVIEREVAQPLAADLAARPPGLPLRLRLSVRGGKFHLATEELRPVERSVFWPERLSRGTVPAQAVLDAAFDDLDRISAALEAHAPKGTVEVTALNPEQARYYHCREQLRRVEKILGAAEQKLTQRLPAKSSRAISVPRPKPVKVILKQRFGNVGLHSDREREAESLASELSEMDAPEGGLEIKETPLFAAVRELALLNLMAEEPYEDGGVGWMIRMDAPDAGMFGYAIGEHVMDMVQRHWGATVVKVKDSSSEPQWWGMGPNLARLVETMRGCILFDAGANGLYTAIFQAGPCSSVEEMPGLAERLKRPDADDTRGIPLIQQVTREGDLHDFRTGLSVSMNAEDEEIRAFYLAALPLPRELAAVFETNE